MHVLVLSIFLGVTSIGVVNMSMLEIACVWEFAGLIPSSGFYFHLSLNIGEKTPN